MEASYNNRYVSAGNPHPTFPLHPVCFRSVHILEE